MDLTGKHHTPEMGCIVCVQVSELERLHFSQNIEECFALRRIVSRDITHNGPPDQTEQNKAYYVTQSDNEHYLPFTKN